MIGDVAYDAFLGEGCTGTDGQHSYEVMIWLAALGSLGPIGSSDDGGQLSFPIRHFPFHQTLGVEDLFSPSETYSLTLELSLKEEY